MGSDSVIITGASSGIGKACALALAARGLRVFAGVRKPEDGARLREESKGAVVPLRLEVTQAASIAAAREELEAALGDGRLTGVVNNAGIVGIGPLEFQPISALRAQLEVNFVGAIAVTQAFLPLLRAAKGRVVFVGAAAGRVALPFVGGYSASKFALEGAADALRIELASSGVKVALIEPGAIATPILHAQTVAQLAAGLLPGALEHYREALEGMVRAMEQTRQRALGPEAVAKVVVHALTAKSPKTRYPVGSDAKLLSWVARSLPDAMRDALVARQVAK
jgi:NAD(P)-dependent dehydrogenase (short-subunit alcohol dehydrogenase family)